MYPITEYEIFEDAVPLTNAETVESIDDHQVGSRNHAAACPSHLAAPYQQSTPTMATETAILIHFVAIVLRTSQVAFCWSPVCLPRPPTMYLVCLLAQE